jgi:hypothetical protein
MGAQRGESLHLDVDLGDPASEQLLGRLARALDGVADREQVADVGEAQAQALAALDERHAVDGHAG